MQGAGRAQNKINLVSVININKTPSAFLDFGINYCKM